MSGRPGPVPKPAIERLMRRVEKQASGCWLWRGALSDKGHGQIGDYSPTRGHFHAKVHRVAYAAEYGDIPEGICVLHKCDVPNCVNPEHLFLGSVADNNADMFKKRRHSYGEKAPWHRLTNKDVLDIRGSVEPQNVLAKKYNVNQSHISRIKSLSTWKLAAVGGVS